MGHWSEQLADELVQRLGADADPQRVAELLGRVGREIDVLTGRSFAPLRQVTSTLEPNGLPFADVPDLRIDSTEQLDGVWAVPDPVNPEIATALQLAAFAPPSQKPVQIADALWIAGQLIASASQTGRLSRDHVLYWLGTSMAHEERMATFRRAMDPSVRISIPVFGQSLGGWWFQVSRRLVWVTNETEEEGRLYEPLLRDDSEPDDDTKPLMATESVLIMAPMDRHPVNWAFTARIWPENVRLPTDRPWSRISNAIHGHGIPTITTDSSLTSLEIACQVVLKAYWHGYIGGTEPALANAVALAYPQPVERIRRACNTPDRRSAATMLLAQLIRPGFNPAQGAEATRRYVRRKASITIMEHRKAEAPDRYPWTQIGISERRYYKLLPLFAKKENGRYVFEQDDLVTRMRAHLDNDDRSREVRVAALEVLLSRGFSKEAARKWLQRHPVEQAVKAQPRSNRA
ncbi:hypothetical protein [Kibdelosporangium aridum]|uniref:hypothetical protein n=1 Tax=Kibdelosporangium aridum TaxID=2030 RepID=UPI000526F43B